MRERHLETELKRRGFFNEAKSMCKERMGEGRPASETGAAEEKREEEREKQREKEIRAEKQKERENGRDWRWARCIFQKGT